MGRSSIALKSSGLGFISQVFILVINFIIRTCFINYLGVEILGIDGVIKDCTSMLSLAELGITSAMVFRLYKAIINNDEEKINDLMTIYKQVYHIISFGILIIGLTFSILLKLIVTNVEISWTFIYLAYYLQLMSTFSTFVLAYKRSILNADQKNYIIILIDTCTNIVFSAAKIFLLIAFHSYILYLVLTVIQNTSSNIFIHIYCRKFYPYLTAKRKINKDIRRELMCDTKNVFAGKIAGYLYNSTDNVIISIFMSTVLVGYLSNYKYIFSAIKSLMNCITSPIQPLIGNYLNTIDDKDQTLKILNNYTQIRYLFSALFIIPTLYLTNLFITIWAGESYLLTFDIVILLAVDFYIGCVCGPLGEYIIAMGMFKYEKYATTAGAVTNLFTSLIGVFMFGLQGVLFATVLSQIVLWICKSYIVFKFYFKNCKVLCFKYWMKQVWYIFIFIIMIFVNMGLTSLISISNEYINFFVKGCVIEVIIISIYFIAFRYTEEYGYFNKIVRNLLKSKLKKS